MKRIYSKINLTVLGSLALAAAAGATAGAEDTPGMAAGEATQGPATASSTPHGAADPWKGEIGDGFRKGAWRTTVEGAAARGQAILGGKLDHDLVLGGVDLGYVFSNVVGQSHWYRGNWEFRTALFGGEQYRPSSAYVAGVAPLLRYNLATGTRLVPFADMGGGVAATDIGPPDLSGTFQFNLQAGVGAHLFLTRRTAATLEYHLVHVSNAGISSPNRGLNMHLVALGLTWFF